MWAWQELNLRPHAYQACALTSLSYKPIRMVSRRPPRCFTSGGPATNDQNIQTITRRAAKAKALLKKEVIQPHLPVRLPCYDLAPVTRLTLKTCLPKVGTASSGTPDFHRLTGGVYKARERIHRIVADIRLLAIPAS